MTSSTISIADTENLQGVFREIMKLHRLNYRDIKVGDGTREIFSTGYFRCPECDREWNSNFSWVTIDLTIQRIVYRWKMKCKACLTVCEPSFSMEQFKVMIERAVELYQGTYANRTYGRTPRKEILSQPQKAPHLPELCEKCGWQLYDVCWRRFIRA